MPRLISEEQRRGLRQALRGLGAFVVLACVTSGCDFPISATKYSVESSSSGPAEHAGWADALEPEARTLVEAFARHDDRCASAFARSCSAAIAECAASAGCVDYGVCMRERADPAAETTCSDEASTSLDDSWRFELVRHCWATRYAECDIGRDFACAGVYGPPSGERSAVEVRQQILLSGAENARNDFSVAFCEEWSDCSAPVLEVVTDRSTGIYDAAIPVGGKNFGVGNDWRGYRLIRGAGIPDSVVGANVPIWGRRLEITRVLDSEQVAGLAEWFGVDALRSVFVQVVDCKSDPAPGITFEVSTSESEVVSYVADSGVPVEGPTVASGAAGITGYDTEQPHTIWAMRGQQVVATWSGELSAGMPRYLRLHPGRKQ